ncbi:hypothetical protein D3C85_501420 [compost metagenome]
MGKPIVENFYPHIERLLQDKAKVVVSAMGRRTGKTTFIVERTRKVKKKNVMVIVPGVTQKATILGVFPNYKLLKSSMTGNKYQVYGKELTLITYTEWMNSGVDYSKENLGIVILDEAAYADPDTLRKLKEKAPEFCDQLYLVSTPKTPIKFTDTSDTTDEFNWTVLAGEQLGYSVHITPSLTVMSVDAANELAKVMTRESFDSQILVVQ